MKNEFQKLVDRELSGLCWNECMRQRVLHSLEKEEKPVKQKMKVGLALTLVLVLVGSLALAAGLMFSPRYDVLKLADDALYEDYGITDELLPFFHRELDETENSVTYRGMEDLQRVTGDYVVTIEKGHAVVAWSLDGAEGGWNAAKLAEINALCKQPNGYHDAVLMARADAEKYGLGGAEDTLVIPTEAEMQALMEKRAEERELVKQAAKLTAEEMDLIGRAALKERFALAEQQMTALELEEDSCDWYIHNSQKVFSLYYWLWQSGDEWQEGNGVYVVNVNVETGAVEEIIYDNGLLGNG